MRSVRPLVVVGTLIGAAWFIHLALNRIPVATVSEAPTPEIPAVGVAREGDDGGDGQSARLRELEKRIAAIELAVAGLENRLKTPSLTTSRAATTPAPEAAVRDPAPSLDHEEEAHPPPEMREAHLAELEAESQQQMDQLERGFWAEPVDRRWSRETADMISRVLKDEALSETAVLGLDCRSTLCRIELQHEDPQMLDEASALLQERVSGFLPRMALEYIDQGDGWSAAIVYMAREGFELP